MSLTQDQEEAKYLKEMEKLDVDIDNARLNMTKLNSDMRWESLKFGVSAAVAIAVAVGSGVGLANYLRRGSESEAQAQVRQLTQTQEEIRQLQSLVAQQAASSAALQAEIRAKQASPTIYLLQPGQAPAAIPAAPDKLNPKE